MTYSFQLAAEIPASPEAVYDAWLDSSGHSAMTGGAASASNVVEGEFTAWDGYIRGRNLELVRGRRIVQSWRTTAFSDADPDSVLTLILTPTKAGAHLALEHSNVPDGHTKYENGGWEDNYFTPMKIYFAAMNAS